MKTVRLIEVAALAIISGCAAWHATEVPAAGGEPAPAASVHEQPADRDTLEGFYTAHPGLKDRKPCVARVLATLANPTWGALLTAAYAACFPGRDWAYVIDGEDRRGTFIDLSRIEPRDTHQVAFWVMTEVFDGEHDFFVSHMAADCSTRMEALLYTAWRVTGRIEDGTTPPLEWERELPDGSVGAALLDTACAYRPAGLRPA